MTARLVLRCPIEGCGWTYDDVIGQQYVTEEAFRVRFGWHWEQDHDRSTTTPTVEPIITKEVSRGR